MKLASTRHEDYDYEGIRIIDMPKWLIGDDKDFLHRMAEAGGKSTEL